MMKKDVFFKTRQILNENNFIIDKFDDNRPWGGFFVIDENQDQKFADKYFNGVNVSELKITGKLSPKILIIEPNKRLSWQYHNRRAEIWKVVKGQIGIIRSNDNTEGEIINVEEGTIIKLNQGERHRIIGSDDWAVVAEIWQHTDAMSPSNEEDIVRVQDDFGR